MEDSNAPLRSAPTAASVMARASGPSLPVARIKERCEDFVVDEVPAYEASGSGDHLFVTFRKRDLTTQEAVASIAKALGASPRDAGVAGIKDKVAVTTQTASFFVPRGKDAGAEAALTSLPPGLEVRSVTRHGNKLKPGHLVGNRFCIALRGVVDRADRATVTARLAEAKARGVPNFYGSQRFGSAGDNALVAAEIVRGDGGRRPPREKHKLRFVFSSLQSWLFNRVLERRMQCETWSTIVPGDLAKKHDTGGLFLVPAADPEALEEARARAEALAICATGPMFGASMRSPEGEALALEREVLGEARITDEQLARFRHAGEGTRRALRLLCDELSWRETDDGLVVDLFLTKGGYATTVLESVCSPVEPRRAPSSARSEANRDSDAAPSDAEPGEEPEL